MTTNTKAGTQGHTQGRMSVHQNSNAAPFNVDCHDGSLPFMAMDVVLGVDDKIICRVEMRSGEGRDFGWPHVDSETECKANAARLAACWNACDGIPTTALAGGAADILEHAQGLVKERDAMRSEVGRLREALQQIADDCKGCADSELAKQSLGERRAWLAIVHSARAALEPRK